MAIRISVIFPFFEERGFTTQVIASWIKQSFPADRFELILVADPQTVIDPAIPVLLRPQDRILRVPFASLAQQYDLGIRSAAGELFFLTEAHCMPAADCLASMDQYLTARTELAGACTASVPSCENAYACIDADTFEEGFRVFTQDGDWRKLNVHGFAMKRAVYLGLGGFAYQYGRFAEMLLAAAMRDGGHKLGYARDAVINHYYRGSLQELIDGIDDYVRGESVYRAAHPGPDRVGFSYLPQAADPYSRGAAALGREVAAALLTTDLGRSTGAKKEGLLAATRALAGFAGRRGPVLIEWLATAWARVRCWRHRNNAARLDLPYRDLIRRATVLSRIRWLADQSAVDGPLPPPTTHFAIDSLPAWAIHGMHGIEWFSGSCFRWTGRVAALRLPLTPGRQRLRIVTHGLRHPDQIQLRAAINGKVVNVAVLPGGDYEIEVESWHRRAGDQTLVLVSNPICPWVHGVMDHRELGLPLFAITASPAEGSITPQRTAA